MKYKKVAPNQFKPIQEFTLRVIERETLDYRIACLLYVSFASVAFIYGYTIVFCLTH